MTESNDLGDGALPGEEIVPGGEPLTEFDEEEADIEPGEEAPTGETLTDEEVADIEKQVADITLANQGRAPDEQVSVDPEEVS